MPPFGEPDELEAFYNAPGWAILLGLPASITATLGLVCLFTGRWSLGGGLLGFTLFIWLLIQFLYWVFPDKQTSD